MTVVTRHYDGWIVFYYFTALLLFKVGGFSDAKFFEIALQSVEIPKNGKNSFPSLEKFVVGSL